MLHCEDRKRRWRGLAVPSRAQAHAAFAWEERPGASEDARLAHLSAELQETGTVSAKRKSTAGALKLSKCGMRSAPLNILSEWGRRGAMRGDGGWGATSGYRIEAKSETRGYAGGRNRDNLGRKHGQGHARRKRFQSLRLEVGRGGED